MAPFTEAMGFVDGEERDIERLQPLQVSLGSQPLGREVQQLVLYRFVPGNLLFPQFYAIGATLVLRVPCRGNLHRGSSFMPQKETKSSALFLNG
jgi:hypothetical protein